MATERRLIDANALNDILEEWEENAVFGTANDGADGTTKILHPVPTTTSEMQDLIAMQPTVDAVEVVRCKECMWARPKDHREPTDTPRELICQCPKHHYIPAPWGARMAVKADDFCSYGERKDND